MSEAPPLRTLARGLELLGAVERASRPPNLTELAAELGEAPSAVHRMLKTLEGAGRIARPGCGKRYAAPGGALAGARALIALLRALSEAGGPAAEAALSEAAGPETPALLALLAAEGLAEPAGAGRWALSPRFLALARPLLSGDAARRLRPMMERLRDRTGETVGLLIRAGRSQVLTALAPSREAIRFSPAIGDVWPLHRGAGGKALLSALPPADREAILAALIAEGEEFDAARLRAEVAAAAERGFAMSVGERLPGAGAVSAPVPGSGGDAVVTITFPAFRAPEDRMRAYGGWLVEEMAALAG